MFILKLPRLIFGISIAALGIRHIIADYISATTPPTDSFISATFMFIGFLYQAGLVTLSAAGLSNFRPKFMFSSLGMLILVWTAVRHLPLFISDITDPAELNAMGMALATAGGAFITADSFKKIPMLTQPGSKTFATIPPLGRFLYGVPMVVFGIQHIMYAAFIASLIPTWVPGNYFLAYSTGLALVAAGVSIIVEWMNRWGSMCLGSMILLFIAILHIPAVMANPSDEYQWISLFQALAIGTSAFVLYRNSFKKSASRTNDSSRPREPSHVIAKTKKHFHRPRLQLKDHN